MLHERHIRTFQSLSRPVNVLTTQSSWLMASLTMGANGLLSGAGSVVADLQVALFRAVKRGDLVAAKRVNHRLYPLQQAFYAPPFVDMHNRMKEALVLLGRLDRAIVRPPLAKIPEAEIQRIRHALTLARVTTSGAEPDRPTASRGRSIPQFPKAVCTENLDPDVVVMKFAKDRIGCDDSGPLNWPPDRRILVQ